MQVWRHSPHTQLNNPNWSVDEPRTYGDTHLLTNHSELISKLRRHCRIAFAMMQVHSEKFFQILSWFILQSSQSLISRSLYIIYIQ